MRPLGGFLKIKNAIASTMIIDSKPDTRIKDGPVFAPCLW